MNFGTYHLKDHAEKWWDMISTVKFQNRNVTWDEFVEVFNSAYFPKNKREQEDARILGPATGDDNPV